MDTSNHNAATCTYTSSSCSSRHDHDRSLLQAAIVLTFLTWHPTSALQPLFCFVMCFQSSLYSVVIDSLIFFSFPCFLFLYFFSSMFRLCAAHFSVSRPVTVVARTWQKRTIATVKSQSTSTGRTDTSRKGMGDKTKVSEHINNTNADPASSHVSHIHMY